MSTTSRRRTGGRPYAALLAGWLMLLLSFACGGDEQKPSSALLPGCTPQCEERCSGDDGCGGECSCEPRCEPGRPCAHEECGMCAANEACVGGKCVCTPSCEGNACLADGCGSTCPCPEGYVQNASGQWVPREECTDNCAVAGWTCGVLCGQACGDCAEGGACTLGSCAKPHCDGSRCDGGCACAEGTMCAASGACVAPEQCTDTCQSAGGATCGSVCGESCGSCQDALSCVDGACATAVNCPACSLALTLTDKTVSGGRVLEAVFTLTYQPVEGEPRPRLADLRFALQGDAELVKVEPGAGLTAAGKQLFVDSKTQKPWRRRADGSYQLMAYSLGSTETFAAGTLLTLRFAHSQPGPFSLALVRRLQTFAPQSADSALQSSAYDGAVLVTP